MEKDEEQPPVLLKYMKNAGIKLDILLALCSKWVANSSFASTTFSWVTLGKSVNPLFSVSLFAEIGVRMSVRMKGDFV